MSCKKITLSVGKNDLIHFNLLPGFEIVNTEWKGVLELEEVRGK